MKYYEFEWNEKCPSYNGRYSYMKNLFWIKQWRRKLEAMLNCKLEVTLYEALQELGFNVDEFVNAGEFREVGFTTRTGIKIKINKDFYLALHCNDSNPCAILRFYCVPLNKEEMFYDSMTGQMFKADFKKMAKMFTPQVLSVAGVVPLMGTLSEQKKMAIAKAMETEGKAKTSAEWLRDTINDVRHKAKLDDFINKD